VQQLHVEGVVELAAQAAHGHLDHVGVAVEVHVPHLLGQRGAREDLPAPAQQHHQQRELLGRELEPRAVAKALAADQVDLQVGQPQHRRFLRLAAAQQRLHARQQFGEGEGLDEVVVRALLQALHAVFDLVARGEHQHGHVLRAAYGLQHRESRRCRGACTSSRTSA
jgi:hypothetical protein